MKKMNKLMAIGLSLALCAGMIAPAFAQDAYFYIKDGDAGWEFAGKGEVDDSVTFDGNDQAVGAVDENGVLDTDVVTAPKGDNQGMQTTEGKGEVPKLIGSGTKEVDVQVKADTSKVDNLIKQGNLTEGETVYVYDTSNGTDDVLNDQYTYSVTWDVKKENGAAAYVDEIQASGPIWNKEYSGDSVPQADGSNKVVFVEQDGTAENPARNAIHVDAIVEKSQNTEVKVVIKDFTGALNEDGNAQFQEKTDVATDSKYIRQGTNIETPDGDGKTVVDRATAMIVDGLDKVNEQFYKHSDTRDPETGEITRTYTERTYNVTYTVTGAGQDNSTTTTHGKVNNTFTAQENKGTVPGVGGYYTFTNWVAGEPDENGNIIYTATCTFTSYPTYDYDFGDTDVTIDDQAVPLAAGPVTRAEFIDYLWRHEGEPDSEGVCTFTDVEDTHEYFDALCWAEENGVAQAYLDAEGHEDGTFEPDELVTVAAVREFLDNFAGVFGTNAVAVADLTTLTGEDGEAVLNCDQVLAEFFGEEYELPEDLDALETDIAA